MHECGRAAFDIEHDTVRARRKFFAHNRHVTQRVKNPIRRCELRTLADNRQTDRIHLTDEIRFRELHLKPGNRLQFIQRTAGKSQTPPGHFS